MMLADYGTKPANGPLLQNQISYLIGVHFYPDPTMKHYILLALFDCSYFKNIDKAQKPYHSFVSPNERGCWGPRIPHVWIPYHTGFPTFGFHALDMDSLLTLFLIP